jgi:class 3 adenylate cyclase
MNPAASRWRGLIAFALVLGAGLSAHSAGLTQKADQALRSLFPPGVIDTVPAWAVFAAVLVALCGWFGRTSWRKAAMLAGCAGALLLLALWWARRGDYLPVAAMVLALGFSGLARFAYDLVYDAWRTEATRAGARGRLCVLVFDLPGFVARAEKLPAEQAIALLNDCFTAVTAAAYRHGGTPNRLLGAGAVALFGASQALDCPEKNALEAAQDILEALAAISERLEAEGGTRLEPAIGVHAGDVAFGQVGGRRRQDYTALGPVVTLAAELQRLASGAIADPVVCSAQVADAVGRAGGLRELGQRTVAGEVLTLFAWTPPVLAPEAEAKTA